MERFLCREIGGLEGWIGIEGVRSLFIFVSTENDSDGCEAFITVSRHSSFPP